MPPLLAMQDFYAGYGPIEVLKGISIEVQPGEIVALIGSNGAGKTSTLMGISGCLRPTRGRVLWEGREIQGLPPHEIVCRGICHAPEGRKIFPRLTVLENLQMGAFTRRDKKEIDHDLARAFELFPILAQRRAQAGGTLSGGEQQMLAVARALMGRPKLLLLDEPSLGLAPLIVLKIFDVVRQLNQEGMAILLVEQAARMALKLAHRGYVMEIGRITFSDRAEALLGDRRVQDAYLGEWHDTIEPGNVAMAFATIEYFSQSLKKCSAINVLFPDNPPLRRPWAVFYLLHGMSDNQSVWMRQTSIERYMHGWPMMVVMPDGGRYCYTNAVNGGPAYEDDLMKDVMGLVERTFPVKAERSGRAIGGLSMGGYGAVKLGLKYPDKFASVHSHSGALAMARGAARDKIFGAELQRIFGPEAEGGPDDPFALIEKIDHGTVPALRIDCGREDFLLKANRDFHQKLESLHIPHEYEEFPGGHTWAYWDEHIREAIKFHTKNFDLKFDDR